MVRIREIIAAGRLGDVVAMQVDLSQALSGDDPFHRLNNPALGGGALLDLGIYCVAFVVDVLGPPVRIQSESTPLSTGVDARSSILLAFDGGAHASIGTALDSRGPCTASVIGTAGRIEVDAPWHKPTSFTVFDRAGEAAERFEWDVPHRGMQFEASVFERLVVSGAAGGAVMPHAHTIAVLEVLDAVREQSRML
jgi:predicted dehydrogenase